MEKFSETQGLCSQNKSTSWASDKQKFTEITFLVGLTFVAAVGDILDEELPTRDPVGDETVVVVAVVEVDAEVEAVGVAPLE